MKDVFEKYILELRKAYADGGTEQSGRPALQELLDAFAAEQNPPASVQHEPKRVAEKGAPDFQVSSQGMILGYVENKLIGENLTKILRSDQIVKYKTLSDNIVLTDYLHFIWINRYGPPQSERLCDQTDFENPNFRLRADRVGAVAKLLEGFLSTAPEGIGRAQQLALALATRSKLLRDYLKDELLRQEQDQGEGRLYGLFQVFRDQVFHELTLEEFADAFAQMLAYGLFLARLNSGTEIITLHNAREHVPGSFRLIRELVDFLTELERREYRDVRWVVEEVLSIINGLNLPAINEDLSFRHRDAISRNVRAADEEEHRLFERDPFIYFYEDYLSAYAPAMRKSRGVYYTPPPVVNFIVRAVDDVLRKTFEIDEGLADHRLVKLLDFACGTGTFLLEVFQRILHNIGGPEAGRAEPIVREHLLKNLFGFEYLIAPYTIAHLKLSQYLRDQGHPLRERERLQVFLTNTLEPVDPQRNLLLPALSQEVEGAQSVKDMRLLVIIGNPPYSVESKNTGKWISAQIEAYKKVDGHDLGERKHSLGDDYVKFLRFAQIKIDEVERGVVGVITNRRFLENVTFRGMRQSLMATFDQIYVLDLGGASGSTYEGGPDENVFDITLGVAITIFAKTGGEPRLRYLRIGGKRTDKYQYLSRESVVSDDAVDVHPTTPNYFFMPHSVIGTELDSVFSLRDVFRVFGVGVYTARDALTTAFSADELAARIKTFAGLPAEEARSVFDLRRDAQAWSVTGAQEDIRNTNADKRYIQKLNYRPFDSRTTYYTGKSNGFISRPGYEVMKHLRSGFPSLVTCRLLSSETWAHALVTDGIIDNCYISSASRERAYAFPLYLESNAQSGLVPNISDVFQAFVDSRFEHHFSPEEILGYIYAVLHAPTYRTRYAESLRIDFPRVPFPESRKIFEELSELGWELVQAHLLREFPRQELASYHGNGDHLVEDVRYSYEDQAISINDTQCFKPVPEAVWKFEIGGYQALEKYLKSRRGRALSLDELNQVRAIADSVAFTCDRMGKIDEAYRSAFPE
ncbi:type ISP restriction/modification enzyme [Methyloceanibacter superfactus]|uniref:type ISP restriction/modification enzyme n=1 Tax=Methyloceanibacter superfactus TaxID=1774969 RepID=UPI00130136B1|nr:type ISP restriction/modification enzyme [Methyloceanibacter superfactus]